jgi:hypothetical protein
MHAQGGTDLYGALAAAYRHRGVDTIYLLTDGQATTGELVAPLAIERRVLDWNRRRRLVIHAISLGGENELLRRLAAATGGQYVEQ